MTLNYLFSQKENTELYNFTFQNYILIPHDIAFQCLQSFYLECQTDELVEVVKTERKKEPLSVTDEYDWWSSSWQKEKWFGKMGKKDINCKNIR